jgi:uncharacterized membrane protein YphA (DoxX/SURF4 family)
MWPFSPKPVRKAPAEENSLKRRDIIVGDDLQRRRTRWMRLLTFTMRLLAVLSLVRGIGDWAQILGFMQDGQPFEARPLIWQISLAAYAVLHCVAAVGLWMTTAWGGVLWLIVTLCEVLIPWVTTGTARFAGVGDYFMLGLVLLYLVLTWAAAREHTRNEEAHA